MRYMIILHLVYLVCAVTFAASLHLRQASSGVPLEWFVKLVGSLDSTQASVGYMNGTVYAREPGSPVRKILLYEGFNIGHQVPQAGGGFLSETRGIVFYRDPIAGEIIHIWENPYSSHPNEVFPVTNDPVNANLTSNYPIPEFVFPDGTLCVPLDFVSHYPNPLDPIYYPLYSAGPVYDAVELFQYHGNMSEITSPNVKSVSNSITWTRMSQWLPWMEMGKTPGKLFYTATSWKLANGVQDLPKEILDLVTFKYPKFLEPPQTYEVPNESSWVSFKDIIDARRAKGEPDIIITPQNITSLVTHGPYVDGLLSKVVLSQGSVSVIWNGTLLPDILNRTAVPLVKFTGEALLTIYLDPNGYRVDVEAKGDFRDPVTGEVLQKWLNPVTKKTATVPTYIYKDSVLFGRDFVNTKDIIPRDEIALTAVTSYSSGLKDDEDWLVDMFEVLVNKQNLVLASKPYFYGTWMRYSSWLPWMNMTDVQGTLICRLHVYRDLTK